MGLSLIAGPANAGKVARLLDHYVELLPSDPVLVVPGRPDVARVERELLARSPALLGGSVGTFDDLFRRIARGSTERRRCLTDAQRALAVRRAVADTALDELAPSARQPGFADALADALAELAAGLVPPEALDGPTRALYTAYLEQLERLGAWDRDAERAAAVRRLEHDLDAWHGEPVLAYGFEDLTAAQWRLLGALAGRTEVMVSLPYEAGRPVFASLERTAADLAALAAGRVTWMEPAYGRIAPPALAYLERALFSEGEQPAPPPLDGAVRWLEAAGDRATAELVAEEALALIRAGQAPDGIAVICPSLERARGPLETAFGTLGVPFRIDAPARLERTPFGKALLALLRFDWRAPTRRDLFRFLRSPYSGLTRAHVDFVEGRLRGRAIRDERVEDETLRLRGAPLALLDELRRHSDPVEATRALAETMVRLTYGLDAPPSGEDGRADLRAFDAVRRSLDELAEWAKLAGGATRDEVLATLERAAVGPPPGTASGRVVVLDLMRARTTRADVVFVLGLEEGSLPRRGVATPFLGEDLRRELDRAARLARPDAAARDRYLFYTACTRPSKRLLLVRAAASDDGAPRGASPFWEETRSLFDPDDVGRWTRRRPLSALTWPLEVAPTERERVRGLAALAADDPDTATALALANGWERRLERALGAFERPTRLTHRAVLDELAARGSFGVTELERFADCSSMWLVERLVDPRSIDAEPDARLRGSVAHTTLHRFFAGLPKRLGSERVEAARLDEALAFLRECLEKALAGVRLDLSDLERLELQGGLWRDLEGLVRAEAELETSLVPRRFELSFGHERSAPELQRGLDLGGFTLSGKIDRVDVDPFSARAIVQDYKSGASAPSAAKIESELRLQIPLYMLVLRDLVGLEPLGGVYRPLAGKREPRGLIRADEGVPGFHRNDYVSDDEFWRHVDLARDRAAAIVDRMRAGDVRHDPKGGDCPEWCELWSTCRVRRS